MVPRRPRRCPRRVRALRLFLDRSGTTRYNEAEGLSGRLSFYFAAGRQAERYQNEEQSVSATPQPSVQPPVIVTDAACDLPPAYLEQYRIRVAPLKILFGDDVYRSGIDITHEEF